EIIHRDDFLAVDLAHELNAAVHGLIADLALLQRAERDGAGTAIAFGAALLGAAGALLETQIVQHRIHWPNAGQLDDLAPPQKPYGMRFHLAPPAGGIAEGREEQRHVIVRLRLGDTETDGYDFQKGR